MAINQFKEKPILISSLFISFIIDIILILLVHIEIGNDHLPQQLLRLGFQIVCILNIIFNKSNKVLFVLSAYHIISGIVFFSKLYPNTLEKSFGIYHIIIGVMIYFHDWFDKKLTIKK